jgi:paraquat-inducible protein A
MCVADCPRCGCTLWHMCRGSFHFPLACGVAALLFYVFALAAPFLEISSYGRFQLARLSTGPFQLAGQGFGSVAVLVFAVTMVFPGIKLGILLLTLTGIETRRLPGKLLKFLFRWYKPVSPWAMIDVYLLGFLVAYTRLTGMAAVHLDTALFSLIGFMVSMAAADAWLDSERTWRALDELAPPAPAAAVRTGILIGCRSCGLLNHAVPGECCRRCDAPLRPRKTRSVSRTWALLCAAALIYIPANIYPVMVLTQLGQSYSYTIMGGIFELVDRDLWPLAALVFVASIVIPLMKLLTLGYMLLATQRRSGRHLIGRTRAFRVIDFIGRWSMIDVFMISILVALVRFDSFANVHAEQGVPFFAGVVVLTLFAVIVFDPRLMWDAPTTRSTAPARAPLTA